MIGSKTNRFLASLELTYGTGSRGGITIEATTVEDNKEYQICADFKQKIEASQTL